MTGVRKDAALSEEQRLREGGRGKRGAQKEELTPNRNWYCAAGFQPQT